MAQYRTLLLVVIAVLIALLVFIFYPKDKFMALKEGAVIILPVKSSIPAYSDLWQQYAAQEAVISKLQRTNTNPVLQVEDVINFLAQSSSYIADTRQLQLGRFITEVGAALVVDSTLTKNANNYQLNYHFYSHNLQQDGSFESTSLDSLYVELANHINATTGASLNSSKLVNRKYFDNPALISALQQLQYGELDAATEELNSFLLTDESNLIAQRQLAEIALKKAEFKSVDKIIAGALKLANVTGDRSESARLGLTLSKSYIEQKELPRSLSTLSQARSDAANSQDWLYLAYIAAWAGHVNQRLSRYDAANQQYQLSVDYHRMVGYQAGQVIALNNLARLALIEYNYSAAYKYVKQSVDIVTQKQLTKLKEETMLLLNKVENKQR